jgi:TRAP transporter TAXI family solute receptor
MMHRMKLKLCCIKPFLLLASAGLASSAIMVAASTQTLPDEVAINSGPVGTQYVQAAAVAAMIEKHTSMKGFVERTKSHVAAMPLFQEKRCDFIFVSQAEMYLANRGTEYYKSVGPTPIRLVAAGTELWFTFFTSPKTGVAKIEDLAGRKVMWDTKTSGVFYWAARYILDYYKIRNEVISIPSPRPIDRAQALKTGRVDSYACSTQYQAMESIHSSVGMKMLDVPTECAEWINERYPQIYPAVCPKGYNGGMVTRDVPLVAASTGLHARANLGGHVVYAVLEALYDNQEEFSKLHPTLDQMTLDRAVLLNSTVPYHTGAIRFFKDRGVWSPEADEMQQRMLKELGATH